jgi:hypothetical protein
VALTGASGDQTSQRRRGRLKAEPAKKQMCHVLARSVIHIHLCQSIYLMSVDRCASF